MNSRVRAIYRIGAAADGPARARQIVTRELASVVSSRTLGDLKLMVSELVTNAIIHGTADEHHQITLELSASKPVVHCEVIDSGSGFTPHGEPTNQGWGLRLVDRLADRWGIKCLRDGTHVWFESAALNGA